MLQNLVLCEDSSSNICMNQTLHHLFSKGGTGEGLKSHFIFFCSLGRVGRAALLLAALLGRTGGQVHVPTPATYEENNPVISTTGPKAPGGTRDPCVCLVIPTPSALLQRLHIRRLV